MKKILVFLFTIFSIASYSQNQNGGVINAKNNAGVIGSIKRDYDNLKVKDSSLLALLQSGLVKVIVVDSSSIGGGGISGRSWHLSSNSDTVFVMGNITTSTDSTKTRIQQQVTVLNPVTSLSVNNFPVTQPVSGTIAVSNPYSVSASDSSKYRIYHLVTVLNPTTSVSINNTPTVTVGNPYAVSASDSSKYRGTVQTTRLWHLSGSNDTVTTSTSGTFSIDSSKTRLYQQVTVLNPTTSVSINNSPTVTVSNPYSVAASDSSKYRGTVQISNFPSTQNVSVTNTPTVTVGNPYSVSAADSSKYRIYHLVNVVNSSIPVTGTFYQSTQPVSAASLPLPTGAATAANQTTLITNLGSPFQAGGTIGNTTFASTQSGTWSNRITDGTNTMAVKAASTAAQASDPAAVVSLSPNSPIALPTITKGTQGSTGITTQDMHDAGRTSIVYYATGVAAGTTTTETAITLTKSSGTSSTSSAASFVITSGKRFRITAIAFATRGNSTATVQTTTFSFRINTGGAVTTSSTPILLQMRSATPATASAWDRVLMPIPEGFEILGDGTIQFGITANATYTTNAPTWDVMIMGYEY